MLNQDPKYNRGIPDLTDMTQDELLEDFKTLEAPTIEEMDGEYHTTKLGYNGIRDEHIDRVAESLLATGLTEIDRSTFDYHCHKRKAGGCALREPRHRDPRRSLR